jgi:cytoskeleton protein RodZ
MAEPGQMQIGKVLKEARTRAGLDIAAIEERTKIRTRYLRALENEEWDALPGPAYAKGWLRNYAQVLGLDAEALVDAYRRQVEGGRHTVAYPLGDQVLERRHRAGGGPRGPRPWMVLAAFVAAIVAVLAVLGLTGGDDDGSDRTPAERRRELRQERREERRREQRREERRERAAADARRVSIQLEIRSPVAVCLLGEDREELIDGQVLAAGATEGPWESRRFELRFPSGYDRSQFRLLLDGEPKRVPETSGPTAYVIAAPERLRPAPTPGPSCP